MDVQRPPGTSGSDDPARQRADLRSRALSSAVLLTVRGFGINTLGLVGYLVLARLLTPRDFGVAAVGLSLVFFAHFVADAGIGAALIRRKDEPGEADYASVVGAQFAVMMAAVLAAACWWTLADTTVAAVSLIYAASLPLLAFRVPSAIALERHLTYRPLVIADVAEVLAYTLWSIGTVLLGFGVFGLATGAIVRTAIGTLTLNRLGPIGWLRPIADFGRIRGLLGFGLKFQLSGAVTLVRDQGLNVATAAILGYPTLGLWTLVGRIMGVPLLVFESLWRVSFPALSRMIGSGEDVNELMRRSVGTAGFVGGLIYVPLAIALPRVVPALVGNRWASALVVLPYVLIGLLASMSISVVASGFLLAKGEAGPLVRANVAVTSLNLVLAGSLMPLVGYVGLGVAQAVGGVVDGWLLSRAVHGAGGPHLFRQTVAPILSAVFAFGITDAARTAIPGGLVWIVGAAALSGMIYLAASVVTMRSDVRNALRLVLTLRARGRSDRRATCGEARRPTDVG